MTILKPVQQWGDSILQVKVPLPFPLRWVNAYVLRAGRSWTLVDPGLHTPEAEVLWQQVIEEWGLDPDGLDKVVLTHHHPDHYGMSGWFQERTGAPVYISSSGKEQVEQLWGEGENMSAALLALFRLHGMDEEGLARMAEHLKSFIAQVSPQPALMRIDESQPFRMGIAFTAPFRLPAMRRVIYAFHDEELKVLFCGDHVLPRITPNVGYIPGFDDNPLQSYISSLKQAGKWEVESAYPGHREPFSTFAERTAEIIHHHEDRLNQMEQLLAKPITSLELCNALFGDRLSTHQLRFALSETIAHLIYLRDEGRIRELEQDNMLVYGK